MRLKSKYRQQYRDGGRVDPQTELPIEPPTEQIEAVSAPPEAPPVDEPPAPSPQPEPPQDDATAALRRQIEALSQAQTMGQQAATANERRQAWLEQTPGAKDHIPALGAFHHAALNAGLADASPQYFDFMESQLAGLSQPAEAAMHVAEEMQQQAAPVMQPTPKFFAPPPARSGPNPSAIVSAPVSREIPTSSGERLRPRGQIKLTPAEVEAARISGITPEEYAKQKIRKAQMVASGEYGEQR
jgi:hypothetical protein